jgi:hypothetical protein
VFTPDTVSALLQHFRFELWSSNVRFVPKIKPYSLGTSGKLHDFFGSCLRTAGISAYTIVGPNLTLLLLWCHPDWSFDGSTARAMILKQKPDLDQSTYTSLFANGTAMSAEYMLDNGLIWVRKSGLCIERTPGKLTILYQVTASVGSNDDCVAKFRLGINER